VKKSIAFVASSLITTLLSAEQIKRIDFVNLSKMSPKIANETIDFKTGDELDIPKINSAIKKFYSFGYFTDVTVINEDGVIQFHFKEKPVIANLEMTGYKQREEDLDLVYSKMGIKKGSLFTKKRLENAKKSLLSELEKDGYVNSVVEIDIEEINENSVSLTFDVNKGEEIIIKKVNYFGAKALEGSDFEDVTVNKEEDYFSWLYGQNDGEVKLDQLEHEQPRIRDVYLQHGYLDSKVEKPFMKVDFTSNNAELNFFIEEGKQYSTNDTKIFLDSSILDPKKLYPELKLKKGRTFNIDQLRQDVDFIKTSVADLGYAFAVVKYDLKKDTKNSKVDVTYNVIPGDKVYINDVVISGNSRTLDRVIRRNVYLAPGDLFNLTDFKDSKNKLKRSGFFDSVEISKVRVTSDRMDLHVKVSETTTGNIILGGGYGSYDGFLLTAGVKDKNVFGSGKSVGFKIDFSKHKHDLDIFLKEPAINDSKYNGSINLYSKTREIEYSSPDYTFEKRAIGISVGAGTELYRNTFTGLVYKLETVKETFSDDNTKDSYDPLTYKNNEDYILSSLKPYISYDSTDDYMFPRNGIKTGTSLEVAGLGGDAKFVKSFTNYKYFHSLRKQFDLDWIVRYKASMKFLIDSGKITQGDSLYLGGINNLRGYQSYAFGPESSTNDPALKQMFANSIELSFPLGSEKLRWNVFYDYGMIGEDKMTDTKRSSTGAAIEWISPVGPIQLIFAKPIGDEPGDKTTSFEFSLGQSF